MDENLTIAAVAIGGLCLPFLCAALALKKHRKILGWFVFACLGGAPLVLLILAFLPKGTESADTQKLFGLSVSVKSLLYTAGAFGIVFAIGLVGLFSAIITIVSAIK